MRKTLLPRSGGSHALVETLESRTLMSAAISHKPTLTLRDPGGVYNGGAYPASVKLNGSDAPLEGVSPEVLYYLGRSVSGPATTTAPTDAGVYTSVAVFPGSANWAVVRSNRVTFVITKARPQLVLSDPSGPATGSPFWAIATLNGSLDPLDGIFPLISYRNLKDPGAGVSYIAPTTPGIYSTKAVFPGSENYLATSTRPVFFTISSPDTITTV